jgi:hypothetical protein
VTRDPDEARQALLDAAHALSLLPPMLREQYVATLRLYADEPWRMGGRCKHCSEPIYQTDVGRWRHTNGMYMCAIQMPLPRPKAEPVMPEADE